MNTADLLAFHDRCPRSAHWGKKWEANKIHPNEALRLAIDDGLLSEEDDPGVRSGDTVMTLAADRGIEVYGSPYECALHNASLADIITTVLRQEGTSWARPEDSRVSDMTWQSGAFVEPSGVRLRRVLIVDRWSDERKQAELHSWRTLGEMCAYRMPMTLTVVVIGQRREEKHHSPWSKGWLHPKTRNLRIRKRSGEGFDKNWKLCWRELEDQISRDKWIDQMHEDGAMPEVLFDRELNLPCPEVLSKIGRLIEKKLESIESQKAVPPPNISVCDWPTPCQFRNCCWELTEPSSRNGFIALPNLTLVSR